MKVCKNIDEIKAYLRKQQKNGKTIGFVPTMGYLHKGHLSLIERAAGENDIVVVSVFVNPVQFGEGEDFDRYPRDVDRDIALAEEAGAKVFFAPETEEMYPGGYQTYVEVGEIAKHLCGKSRPGHFRGVATVVTKLFNIVRPERAYFGQKDAQQVIVIKRMVRDLNMDVSIVVCPVIREAAGLAMSSRNVYLNQEERRQALVLRRSLDHCKALIEKGERNAAKLKNEIETMIREMPLARIDYVSVVDAETLEEVDILKSKTLVALAVYFGGTRLIDNILVEV